MITSKQINLLEEAVFEYERGRDTYENGCRDRQRKAKQMKQAIQDLRDSLPVKLMGVKIIKGKSR